jgi:excisionase family DNA binding protein
MLDKACYSVAEAAAELGLSPWSVYRLVSQKKLVPLRPGPGRRKITIPKDELERYILSSRGDAGREEAKQQPRKRRYEVLEM